MKRASRIVLALTLCASMGLAACTMSQFDAVMNQVGPAIATIIQIIAIARGIPLGSADLSVATKVSSDVAALEKLYSDYQTTSVAGKPGVEGDINSGFVVLNGDLSSVFSVAQVSNPNTQAKVTALINLVETGVGLAEAMIPSSAVKFNAKAPANFDANAMVKSFNQILVAKTGNTDVDSFTAKHKIHIHSRTVRVLTLGFKS